MTCDFQQCGILTSVDSGEPVQPPFKLRNSKWCSVSILTVVEYSSDLKRLWSNCAYAQAGLSHCWSHIPHCWKSHVKAHWQLKQSNQLCILSLALYILNTHASQWNHASNVVQVVLASIVYFQYGAYQYTPYLPKSLVNIIRPIQSCLK